MRELENFARRYLILGEPFPEASNDGPTPAGSPIRTAGALPPQLDDLKTQIRGIKGEAETLAIRRALEKTNWNRKAAAGLLKISYKSFLLKVRQYGVTQVTPVPMTAAYNVATDAAACRPSRKMAAHAAG